MSLLRRVATAVVATAIGIAGFAAPVYATPAVSPDFAAPKPNEVVPKDKAGNLVLYVDGAQGAPLAQAAAKAGGKVVTAREDRAEITIAADKVADLARQPGVGAIRRPDLAVPMGSIDPEGLHASGADKWFTANGNKGVGVKIGIIDPGFGGLAAAQQNGTLPTGAQLTANLGTCASGGQSTTHGTSIAEIVHAMAPDAPLFLVCAGTSMEFAPAANWLQQQGVQVVTAALGFLTAGRGDGSGVTDSPADVVRRTSQAGMFWAVSAGNLALGHYGGNATTAADGWLTYFDTTNEANGFNLAAGATATIGLRWDAWPKTDQELDLYVSTSPTPPDPANPGPNVVYASNNQKNIPGGGEPTAEVRVSNPSTSATASYYVYVRNVSARQSTRLDLFVDGASGFLQFKTPEGSVTEPATSPYAMAVGASKANSGSVETFSGRGPTIDGRMKPDLIGYDAVSTSDWSDGGFGGTSAAAAHVAGAAALLKSQFLDLDAVRLQNELVTRANPQHSDNLWGNGGLYLGMPGTPPLAASSGYTALDPAVRTGEHFQKPNTVQSLALPVPADATAAEVTFTARTAPEQGDDVASSVDVFPNDPAQSGSRATAVAVRPGGGSTSVTMLVTLGPDRNVRLRTGLGWVWTVMDVRGYFSPSSASNYFSIGTPRRLLDTRGSAHTAGLQPGATLPVQIRDLYVQPVAPPNATAVAIDVTGLDASSPVSIDAYGQSPAATSTVLTAYPGRRRSSSVIVPIAQDGTIHLRNQGNSGSTQLAVDVTGWFAPSAGGRYVPLTQPNRVVDTITGTGQRTTPLGEGEAASFQIGGLSGIPQNATAAVLNTTAKDDNVDTELSVYPDEAGWAPVTSLAARQGQPEATTTITDLGASGKVDVRSEHSQANVAIDAWGYFVGGRQVVPSTDGCRAPIGEAGYTTVFDGRAESGQYLFGWQETGQIGMALPKPGCTLVNGTGDTNVRWNSQHSLGNDYTVKLDWETTADDAAADVLVLFPNPGSDSTAPGSVGVRIAPSGAGAQATGAITGLKAPGDTSMVKPLGQWNTYEITVAWNSVTVKLNGVQVNGYTTATPTAVAANTYFGIRDSGAGAGSAVAFRNIRVKRNEPVSSGPLTGAGGNCLDLKNYDVANPTLWTYSCNGSPAQTFTRADGTLAVGGRCVDAKGGAGNGSAVGLAACSGVLSQNWVQRSDGSVIGAASGRCLTAAGTAPQAGLSLQDCAPGSSTTQVWQLPAQHGLVGALTGPGGRCLDLPGNDPRQNALFLFDCNRSVAQQWVAVGDGTLRVDGRCLDSGGTTPGTGVPLLNCAQNGSANQQWVPRPDGTLVNPKSSLCLTAASGNQNAAITVDTCTGGPLQQWRLGALTLWRGQLVGVGGKCVDVKGNDPNSGQAWLWNCYGPAGQFWNSNGDGTIQAFGKCLDSSGTANASGVTLNPCSGASTQLWEVQQGGHLYNVGAARVLDDQFGHTDDGTSLQVYDSVTNAPNQRWSTPLRSALDGS